MIVLTCGTFDLLHSGHIALLRRCRALADVSGPGSVIVGLNTDPFIRRYRGQPPTLCYADREAPLAACRYVDAVLPNDQADGSIADLVRIVRPGILAVGDDWRDRDYLGQIGLSASDLSRFDLSIVFLPYTPGQAGPTTAIKRRIVETTALAAGGEMR